MQPIPVHVLKLLSFSVGFLLFVLMTSAAAVSVRENERRAALRFLLLGAAISLPYFVIGWLRFPQQGIVIIFFMIILLVVAIVIFVPTKSRHSRANDTPLNRIDERDTMFSRRRLVPGSKRFEQYYQRHPAKKELDDKFREKPGLLGKHSVYHNPYLFAAAKASFATVKVLRADLDKKPVVKKVPSEPAKLSTLIKWWGKKLGAVSVGITELKSYHLYSHRGRNEPYGQPIMLKHDYAIALTVEMSKDMLELAPASPTVMESAQQYLSGGVIAVQIAEFVRNLGYPARAHIDGDYQVVCPLVARDAGLGEIGRMGLLMTPELGPRVRLAAVTTDLPLVPDHRLEACDVVDFCSQCKKCADACPSRAIPSGDQMEIDGVKRWQISSEACYTYWCHVGTDCARCISVCPYSHPNNWLHKVVRVGVRNSRRFRKLALRLDDFIYGKIPPPRPLPEWAKVGVDKK